MAGVRGPFHVLWIRRNDLPCRIDSENQEAPELLRSSEHLSQITLMAPAMIHLLPSRIGITGPVGIASFLLPILHTQRRAASILSNLSDNQSAYKKRIRRGRGPASGKGKTAGRGYNGQKQKGKVPRGFNGGQTPLEVSHGLRGFTNV